MRVLGKNPRGLLVRLGLAYVLVTAAGHFFAEPILRRVVPVITPGVTIASVTPKQVRIVAGHAVARVAVRWTDPQTGRLIRKTGTVRSRSEILLIGPILLLTLLLAYRARSWSSKALSLGIAALLAPWMLLLDLPFAIAAAVIEQNAIPATAATWLTGFWWFFLDNGGRQLLGLSMGALSLYGGAWLDTQWRRARRASSERRPASKPARGARRHRRGRAGAFSA